MMKQIRLAGRGGQGQILAGIVLAEAAVAFDGLHATQSQSYGPESRGGASRAEVVISDSPVDYPKVTEADCLLCMSQEAYDTYRKEVTDDGLVLVDSTFVEPDVEDEGVIQEPITSVAENELGRAIVANMVALGILVQLTEVVSVEAARQAIVHRVPSGTEELNVRAFEKGLSMGEKTQ